MKGVLDEKISQFWQYASLASCKVLRYRLFIVEISQSRATLNAIREELAAVFRDLPGTRAELLEPAGLTESAFDSAWSRGTIKLVWVLWILEANRVDPREFFNRAFHRRSAPQAKEEDPRVLKAGLERMEAGK